MAHLDYTSKAVTLDEIVFEDRNKQYGAYWLRKNYDDYVVRGLIIAGIAFTLAIAGPMLYELYGPKPEALDQQKIVEVALATPPPPPPSDLPPPPPLPAAPPPPAVTTIKFPPPEIVPDEVVQEDPPKQEELKQAAIGTENVKGDENVTFENVEVATSGTGTGVVEPEAPSEFTVVEQMPEAGYNFLKFMADNIRYPGEASRNEISGTVYINFQVAPDGSIRDVKVTKGIGYGCDEEAVRVVSKMPPWQPGKQGGRSVPVRCQLPVKFKLN